MFSWEKQGKGSHTMGPERAYTIEASDPEKKGGFPRWWCILFSSLVNLKVDPLLFLGCRSSCHFLWERAKVSHKRVFTLLRGESPQLEMPLVLQKPVFALLGCQQISVTPDPEVTEQKKLWCMPFAWENKRKGYTL